MIQFSYTPISAISAISTQPKLGKPSRCQGIYLAPSQYEAGFTSLAHTEEDIDRTIAAAKEVFAAL